MRLIWIIGLQRKMTVLISDNMLISLPLVASMASMTVAINKIALRELKKR
jgi:hypothetical protein